MSSALAADEDPSSVEPLAALGADEATDARIVNERVRLAAAAASTTRTVAPPFAPVRRRVLVLNVGGTLGMDYNAEGALEPRPGFIASEMRKMADLRVPSMPLFDVHEHAQRDSSDMGPADWAEIAEAIKRHYHRYDGFLICHGTDTMHYTAAALSFMLRNLGKPVILTGAMVPLVEAYNDARRNIIIALMFAARGEICDVCIFVNDVLLRGNRAVKARQTVSAFLAPNFPPLARIDGSFFALDRALLRPRPSGPLILSTQMDQRVLVCFVTPGSGLEELASLLREDAARTAAPATHAATAAALSSSSGTVPPVAAASATAAAAASDPAADPRRRVRAVLLELGGVGAAGLALQDGLATVVRAADAAGVVVCFASYWLRGGLSRRSHDLERVFPSVVDIGDMTTETAAVKLMFLLGRGLSVRQVRRYMKVPMRGELTVAGSHL